MHVTNAVPIVPSESPAITGDIGDIAFALAAYQLENLDADLSARLGTIKSITELKKAYRERIASLQDVLKDLHDSDSKTWVDGDLGRKADFTIGSAGITDSSSESIGSDFTVRGQMLPGGELEGSPTDVSIGEQTWQEATATASALDSSTIQVEVSRQDVETEIARLQGKMDELSGDGELGLLAINSLLGKRNQVMQLASNMLSSSHQNAMGIINNIK